MKYISKDIVLKSDIYLDDYVKAYELSLEAEKIQKEIDKIKKRKARKQMIKKFHYYLLQILQVFAVVKKPKLKHIRYLNAIMKEVGMLDKKKSGNNPKEDIYSIAYHFSASLNKTPDEIVKNVKKDQVEQLAKEVQKREVQETLRHAQAYHLDYKEHKRHLESMIRRLKNTTSYKKIKAATSTTDFGGIFEGATR
jgi:hypothetical protein